MCHFQQHLKQHSKSLKMFVFGVASLTQKHAYFSRLAATWRVQKLWNMRPKPEVSWNLWILGKVMKHESVWKPSWRARRWQQSAKQFVILRSSAFKPESIRPCGRRLATHRRMAVATVLVAVVLEVWSYRRNSGFLYKTCFSWCFTYISSCACSCTSVKWNEAGWKHEWSLCRGPASSAGGFAITERGRLCPRRWKFDW